MQGEYREFYMTSELSFIAHRGYSAVGPENTPDAFAAAMEFAESHPAVRGIEFDVRLTGDGQIVVFHDSDLDRRCDSPLVVHETPYEQLAEVSAGAPQMGNQQIPLLSEVLGQIDHRVAIYCEIKADEYDWDILIDGLAAQLAEYRPAGDVIVHSFSAEMLHRVIPAVKGLGVQFALLFSTMEKFRAADGLAGEIDFLHPKWNLLTRHADEILACGKAVNTWTVNRRKNLESIIALNRPGQIVGVITDDLTLCEEA